MSKPNTETVKVMVRVRPMNKDEMKKGCQTVLKVDKATNQLEIQRLDDVHNEMVKKPFTFDSVYDVDS